jgi:hypothetical protein
MKKETTKHYMVRSRPFATACGVEKRNVETIDSVKETRAEFRVAMIRHVTCKLCLRSLLRCLKKPVRK